MWDKIKLFISNKKILYSAVSMLLILALLVLSVFVYLNSSFGWFATNKTTDGNGQDIEIEKFEAQARYYVYIYDSKESTSTTSVIHYTGEGLQTDPSITSIDMQFYDTIFKKRNRYTPAIIRIELYELQKTSGTVNVLIKRNTSVSSTVTSGDKVLPSNYLTNAIRFSISQSKHWYNSDASALFTSIDSTLYQEIVENEDYTSGQEQDINGDAYMKGNSEIFVSSFSSNNGSLTSFTKSDYISLSVPFQQSDIVNNTLNIYLYLSYDKDLVDCFGITGISSNSSAIGQTVDLQNDIDELLISITD